MQNMRRFVFLLTFLLLMLNFEVIVFSVSAQQNPDPPQFKDGLLSDRNRVFSVPQLGRPTYLAPIIDPTFNTNITRIGGDSRQSFTFITGGTGTWGDDVRHRYSKEQPWNSDSSLIALENRGSSSSHRAVYLDGDTYEPKYPICNNYASIMWDDVWRAS